MTMQFEATVFVVDDDASARDSLQWLLESAGHRVEAFSSGTEFLNSYDPRHAGCIVLDLKMAEIDGLDVQRRLNKVGGHSPVIFVTGHGNVTQCAKAMRNGAFDFLEKPIRDETIMPRINRAIAVDRLRLAHHELEEEIASRLKKLTSRERQVMEQLVAGRTKKSISAKFGICIQTVAKHRASIMKKLDVDGEVELARLVVAHDYHRPDER